MELLGAMGRPCSHRNRLPTLVLPLQVSSPLFSSQTAGRNPDVMIISLTHLVALLPVAGERPAAHPSTAPAGPQDLRTETTLHNPTTTTIITAHPHHPTPPQPTATTTATTVTARIRAITVNRTASSCRARSPHMVATISTLHLLAHLRARTVSSDKRVQKPNHARLALLYERSTGYD